MKILVVDDDRVLADVITFMLHKEGFEVIQAYDGVVALARWEKEDPDLLVLDVNMPKMGGFEVCRRIRAQGDTPILMLTVRGEEEDILNGFEIGVDDYMIKPFSPGQLVARVKAILRRSKGKPIKTEIVVGNMTIFPGKREVRIETQQDPVSLTHLENLLLEYLMINAGQVLTIDMIIDHVWGPSAADRNMLRQLVHRLRVKIEPDPANPVYIQTVPGLGYGLLKKG
ncbi:MAG: response regulator transcription factor [Anaerolineales bacterium]|nr:response regulator transcription factor [Anaerolineales bacterium]